MVATAFVRGGLNVRAVLIRAPTPMTFFTGTGIIEREPAPTEILKAGSLWVTPRRGMRMLLEAGIKNVTASLSSIRECTFNTSMRAVLFHTPDFIF